jgi:hypothetical protein
VSPTAQVVVPGLMADLRGVNLLGHIADMLINERPYRALREAADVNDALTSSMNSVLHLMCLRA